MVFIREIPTKYSPLTREEIEARQVVDQNSTEGDESRRLAIRQDIRLKMAAAQVAERRLGEIQQAIAVVESEIDLLADEHSRTCVPLQNELRAIEEAQISGIISRRPADAVSEARRVEILEQVRMANEQLELAIQAKKSTLATLENERLATAKQAGTSFHHTSLYRSGRPDLLAAHFAAEQAVHWATLRSNAANEKAKIGNSEKWDAEVAAASAALTTANRELARVFQAILDE